MGLEDSLVAIGSPYLLIIGGTSVLVALTTTILAILRSHGYVKETLFVPVGINIISIIGNYLFLFGPFGIPVLGVTGVAISTVIANSIGMLIAFYLLKHYIGFSVNVRSIGEVKWRYAKTILVMGIPSSGEPLSYAGAQVFITMFVAMMGTAELTTKVYTQNIGQFITLFSIAIGQATAILVGHLVGGRRADEAYKQGIRSWKIGLVFAFGLSTILYLFAEPIISLLTNDPDVIALSKTLFLLTILLEGARTTNIVMIGSLNGSGDVKYPVLVGIIVMWVISLPLAYYFGIVFALGLAGIWLAFIIDEWLRAGLMLYRWRSRIWTTKAVVFKEDQDHKAI